MRLVEYSSPPHRKRGEGDARHLHPIALASRMLHMGLGGGQSRSAFRQTNEAPCFPAPHP
ncbi:hypothetical protein BOSE62_150301 [Bosea sp. 62]|nr:hypothetical protein BOSE62_150301 [Bosea sp. 62]